MAELQEGEVEGQRSGCVGGTGDVDRLIGFPVPWAFGCGVTARP